MTGLEIGVAILLFGGVFFCFVGSLGLVRLPDFYTRTHACGVTDTLGATLIFLGLIVYSLGTGNWLNAGRFLIILAFIYLTSPLSSHALVKAAYSAGIEPILEGDDD